MAHHNSMMYVVYASMSFFSAICLAYASICQAYARNLYANLWSATVWHISCFLNKFPNMAGRHSIPVWSDDGSTAHLGLEWHAMGPHTKSAMTISVLNDTYICICPG